MPMQARARALDTLAFGMMALIALTLVAGGSYFVTFIRLCWIYFGG